MECSQSHHQGAPLLPVTTEIEAARNHVSAKVIGLAGAAASKQPEAQSGLAAMGLVTKRCLKALGQLGGADPSLAWQLKSKRTAGQGAQVLWGVAKRKARHVSHLALAL